MSQIAIQMYTTRDFQKDQKGLEQTLHRLRQIGYAGVEVCAIRAMEGDSPEVSHEDLAKMLQDQGLRCISMHSSFDRLRDQTDEEMARCRLLGCDYVSIGPPKEVWDGVTEGFRRWIPEARNVAAKLKAGGVRLGIHNHHREFQGLPGQRPMDVMIEQGGSDVMLELDTYWIAHAGANPVKPIMRCQGRVPIVHLKDKIVQNYDTTWGPIGEGNLEWDEIIPACKKCGTEWYVVEIDECPRDVFDCLRSSYDYLKNNWLQG